ncbi:hypothetical protein JCM1840_004377 [Sporobolomyces johnsonii]
MVAGSEQVWDGTAPRHRPPLAASPSPAPASDDQRMMSAEPAVGQGQGQRSDGAGGHNTRRRANGRAHKPMDVEESPPPLGSKAPSPSRGSNGSSAVRAVTPPALAQSTSALASPARAGSASPATATSDNHNTRFSQHRRPPAAQSPPHPSSMAASFSASTVPIQPTPLASATPPLSSSVPSSAASAASPAAPTPRPVPAASAKPPLPRIPTFPLVDSYVPDPNSTDRRHPRQLVPRDLGFPTAPMDGKIRKEDLDDRLLMATCAVLHSHENRALCPKEVAEVMLERGWLKNAGTTPFAHVSTCIRSHIGRAASATPPYLPLLTPFELVGALTAEEVRAVGLHAEQRPAVKRGTLWYLNPQVFGPGIGADDPFVRCRKEAGMAPSEKDGLYVRGLVPLQPTHASLPPPGLRLSSALYHSNGAEEGEGDEEGMGRGKRKRRASSAMMAAMSTAEPSSGLPNLATSGAASPMAIPAARSSAGQAVGAHRRAYSLGGAGPSSAPVRSAIPKLKLRLTSLEEVDSDVVDSDGHTGEAAARRRKNKKKARRAGSEGMSRADSVDSSAFTDDEDDLVATRPTAFSSASSSALLAQSLLAASTSSIPRSQSAASLAPQSAVSPDILSLAASTTSFPFSRPPSSLPTTSALHLSMSAPNIFSHHFQSARSPPEMMDTDAPDYPSQPSTAAVSPARTDSADEEDFHEAMLRGDDFDFEWGADSYTTGTSSVTSNGPGSAESSQALALPLLSAKARGKLRATSPSTPLDESTADEGTVVDTPATTPRDPDETEKEELDVSEVEEKKVKDDEEKLEGPLGAISRVGMDATLCGAMPALGVREEDDEPVVIKVDEVVKQEHDGTNVSSAPLTSLVHETPARHRQPSLTRLTSDASILSVSLPSPLGLSLSPMLPMANTFAATDFDFVGDDEDDRSAFFRSSSYSYDHADSADDEDEDDDIVTVKVEDDDISLLSSQPSSRASSTYPIDAFDRDVLHSVRAASASSSSSESEGLDPMLVVSTSMLATGLPVPQAAPSPPETTEWSMNVDMFDELDAELGTGVDLLAPESIGLEELDLAWAGDEGEGEDEFAAPVVKTVRSTITSTLPRSGLGAFLTGSSPLDLQRFTSPIPSPRRTSAPRVPLLTDFGKGLPTVSSTPSLTRRPSSKSVIEERDGAGEQADEDAEEDEDEEAEEEEEEEKPLPPRRTTRVRRSSTIKVQADATVTPRKSRRHAAAK